MKYMKVRPSLIIIISAVIMLVVAACMLTLGSAGIPLSTVAATLIERLTGYGVGDVTAAQKVIIWDIRWQRIALAIIVGSGLAVSGSCFQTVFKNPLADPFVLGVSSGAALGAAVAVVTHNSPLMITFAFAGAMASMSLVYLFSSGGPSSRSDYRLLLAGIACAALLNAILYAVMALHSQQMQIIIFWLMGSMTGYLDSLKPVVALVAAGAAAALFYARDLDVLALGDEQASYLGVDVAKVKIIILVSTTLVTGVCVAVSGIIGFVGLIVPHMARRIAGPEHLTIIPLSAVWGATLLLLADGLTRMIPLLGSIPVGVVTALFGSPFFLYILRRGGRRTG